MRTVINKGVTSIDTQLSDAYKLLKSDDLIPEISVHYDEVISRNFYYTAVILLGVTLKMLILRSKFHLIASRYFGLMCRFFQEIIWQWAEFKVKFVLSNYILGSTYYIAQQEIPS